MPISKKRFSKKRAKKSIKKNTRKDKKRTPHRKHRKSGKRFRFFGGYGEDEECAICSETLTPETTFTTNCEHNFHRACIERWCNGKRLCPCPICRRELDPNPNPRLRTTRPTLNPRPRPRLDPDPTLNRYEYPPHSLFRVEFFNARGGPVSVDNISFENHDDIIDNFVQQFPGTSPDNYIFVGIYEPDPYGYIELHDFQLHEPSLIRDGDIDIETNPQTIVRYARITEINEREEYDFPDE